MRTAAILAGGQARRFGGRAKALLPLGTLRLIDRQLNVLRPVVDEIGIVTTDRAQYDALGVPVWQDLSPGKGPAGRHSDSARAPRPQRGRWSSPAICRF